MAVRQLTPLRMSAKPAQTDGRASTRIYRPFFIAGILTVLTAGCTLGAIALLGIALKGSYIAAGWTPYVLAHANSQLYGWVGFFIMGFALQQHAPRMSKVALFHRLAYASLALMAVGIGLRFAAEPLADVQPNVWIPVGVFSCLLQLAAVILFNVNTAVTRFRPESGPGESTGRSLPWQTKLVFASLFWWTVVAVCEPFYFYLNHTRGVMFVAEWFPPLREAQFAGFVVMMIFGVAFVKMNSCFGAKPALQLHGEVGFVLWNVGLVARMVGWITYFQSGMATNSSWLYNLGGVLMAASAVLLVLATRLFERTEFSIPAHKFVRGAMAWLLIAGALLLFEPLHLRLVGSPFSHAYLGAVRHALTVGFISQMILGVGMHVVSNMNDLVDRPQLWSVFWLLNIGNLLRVSFEIATDYAPNAFLPMGATGFIELAALSIWAWHVGRPLVARKLYGTP